MWGLPRRAGTPERYDIPIYEDDGIMGSEDAPVTIVEFSDYQCPYCRSYHNETFGKIISEYGDVIRYVYKDLPLESSTQRPNRLQMPPTVPPSRMNSGPITTCYSATRPASDSMPT